MTFVTKAAAGLCAAVLCGLLWQSAARAEAASDQSGEPARRLVDVAQDSRVEPLTLVRQGSHFAHILPTVDVAKRRAAVVGADSGPLVYHAGGVVMTGISIYDIFWAPPKLQTGATATMSGAYEKVQLLLAQTLPEHGITNNSTQYYQTISGVTTYFKNQGGLSGYYVDTAAYPASGCTDSVTPGNCITDAQLQTELQRVMTLKGWTGGLNKIYMVYTALGEGSCFDSSSTSCAYTAYCAYHSAISGNVPIIYANEPFGVLTYCQNPGTPSPNNNAEADTAATSSSHEISEANTDPELDAWFTSQGNEIGDLCAYNYGTNTWDLSSKTSLFQANQSWNGAFFELQMEFDNHFGGCVQVGP